MAISVDPATTPLPAPATSALGSLRCYVQLIETRRSLQAEMEQALSSFLTATPTPLSNGPDLLSASGSEETTTTRSPCAAEAIRPPTEPELQQVLQIAFGGLVEVKEQARLVVEALEERWQRPELARIVRGIEVDESARIKATLERDQLRRLQTLQPELEFASSIREKDAARTTLAGSIQEQMQELHAEIADLAAAEAAEE
ncbi:hypothetical protein JCM8115_000697 [Rhodotorula mucilaginosa]|uniref:Uncharacterized protein n=1 Tax=Rhodotorula mucilaginosa TaxID=5537 RepID=A0A9P6VWS2_RHOMI|nr:hypothetical protein C6P46_006075 [Rhodotorula mucilaginosa]TKA54322.1 hypothetical protein B0A53_03415 [Rhodotorula sp. CCFEE 5036]